MTKDESPDTVIVGGEVFVIVATRDDGLLTVSRPNGIKQYLARRLPDSPLYGEKRAVIVPGDAREP